MSRFQLAAAALLGSGALAAVAADIPVPASAPEPAADLEVAAHFEAAPADAEASAVDPETQTIVVSGQRRALTADLPQSSAGVTASELQDRVFVNTEDALKHLPSVGVRKRYIGDRNGLMSGRSHNPLQAPRGVVYADGVLLSNFLGRFNAPRWNMVAPEEISRVDTLYGPFSALYPGNSIGTTVLITTRDPVQRTASGRAQYFSQSFSEYGYDSDYGGHQFSAYAGDAWGRWSGSVGVNELASESHPMQYATGTLLDKPTQAQRDAAVPVTGAILDRDPRGVERLILGPNGASIEDDLQRQVKGRLAYQTDTLRADGQLAYWRNDYERDGVSFLRDAAGNTVRRGTIRSGERLYSIADSAFGPQEGLEEHVMAALTVRTLHEEGWNYSSVLSLYDIGEDELRESIPSNANAQNGRITDGSSGEGWWNLDLQASYRRADWAHALTAGYYRSRYELDQRRYDASDWRRGARGRLNEVSAGNTVIQAVYLQDAWTGIENWTVTAGLRLERWEAFDGRRANFAMRPGSSQREFVNLDYAERSDNSASPKLSVAYAPGGYTLRYSVGRGVRYPTVSELFQGSAGFALDANGQPLTTVVNNNASLRPEDAIAHEIAWELTLADRHQIRASLFRDDVDDTIHQQTNVNVTPNITNIQNVDNVLTQGLELVYGVRELLPNLDVDANLTLADSEVRENRNNRPSEGKRWVRIPNVRANLVTNWRFAPGFNANLSLLHVGKNFAELDNSDDGGCRRFGCASSFTSIDTRLGYTFAQRYELGLGVANLTDENYYEFHPYPQRTLLAELRGRF